jgi:hypothetical protein
MASFPGMGGPPPTIDPEYAAESNATKLMAVITLFQVLSLITVVLRVYCRVVLVKSPGIDDLVMVLGLVSPSDLNVGAKKKRGCRTYKINFY